MNRNRGVLAGWILTVLGLVACAGSYAQESTLRVVGVYPVSGVAAAQEVVVYFSEDIAEESKAKAPWADGASSELFADVQYEWEDNYVRVFVSKDAFNWPKPFYVLELRSDIKGVSGAELSIDDLEQPITTNLPLPSSVYLARNEVGVPQLCFTFNFDVDLDQLKQKLEVTINDERVDTLALTGFETISRSYRLELPNVLLRKVEWGLKAGFSDASGQVALKKDHQANLPIRKLELQSTSWIGDQSQAFRIKFASTVRGDLLTQYLELALSDGTSVPFEIAFDGARSSHDVILQEDLPVDEELSIKILAGLMGEDSSILPDDVTQRLRRPLRSFGVGSHYWQNGGISGPVLSIIFGKNVDVAELRKYLRVEPDIGELDIQAGNMDWMNSSYVRRILISGAWRPSENYTLFIDKGLPSTDANFILAQDIQVELRKIPSFSALAFAEEGKIFFPRRASGKLKVQALNRSAVEISISEVFSNNLVYALGDLNSDRVDGGFNYQWTRPVAKTTLNFSNEKDVVNEQVLDLNEILEGRNRGIYTVQMNGYSSSPKIVLWTDLGVLTHWQRDGLVVFVHDLYNLNPVEDAKVTIYSNKNQLLGSVTTNSDGLVHLDNFDNDLGEAKLLVVETANDATFLNLIPRSDDDTPFDGSMDRYDREGYDAFLYADRNLYRPGETIHTRFLVRKNYGDAVANVPFRVELHNPKGSTVYQSSVKTSAVGSGGFDIETKDTFLTGKYTLELWVPGNRVISRYEVNIEDFVPNRIEADVKMADATFGVNTPHKIDIEARHLFGAPASARKSEVQVLLSPASFKPDGYPGYHFGNDTPFETVVENLGQKTTDDTGKAEYEFEYTPRTPLSTPLRALVRAQVFEVGGRAVVATDDRLLLPGDAMLGVRIDEAGEREIEVNVAAVLADETPAPLEKVEVILERRTWGYYVRRMAGYNSPGWTEHYEAIDTREVAMVNGRGEVHFKYPRYGYYRVRVKSEETPQYSTQNFCAYWYGPRLIDGPDPSLITLRTDKDEYSPDDKAVLSLESPFDGRGIVVLQGEDFEEVLPVEVKQGKGEVQFNLPKHYAPNIWAEVTIIHGVEPGSGEVYPYSSFAVTSLRVKEADRVVDVTIPDLPEVVRPAQEQTVKIETHDYTGAPVSAEVTLSAVDDGIHNILGYDTPDPAAWFARDRAPDYRRAHYYDKVAFDFEAPVIGGDLLKKRLGKDENIGENWIKPVALWTGTFQTDENGKAEVKLDLPEFNGRLRLVAVAVTEKATGVVEKKLKVRRPYILRTTMPRFTLPGDKFSSRAVVFNTTDAPVTARLRCTAEQALLGGPTERVLEIGPESDVVTSLEFTADNLVGQGALNWQVEIVNAAGNVIETLKEYAPIPVHQPSSYRSEHELVTLAPGSSQTFKNSIFLDVPPMDAHISVGASLTMQLENSLQFLVGYPYGCIEQTMSRCLPTYLMRQNAALVRRALGDTTKLDNYLQAGIDRLFTMQVSGGGLAYWPGGVEAYPFGSIYGCHFLTLVRNEPDLDVPQSEFKRLQSYVSNLAAGNFGDVSEFHRAYACYVLSLGDDLKGIEMIERLNSVPMPRAGRYLLAAALARQTDDREKVLAYLAEAPMTPYYLRETAGALHSEPRNKALEFLALLEMGEPLENLHEKAEELLRFVTKGTHRNTQDTAFLVAALGKYMERASFDPAAVSGEVQGPGGTKPVSGETEYEDSHHGTDGVYTVRNTGSTVLYVNWSTSGVPKEADKQVVSEGISITRTISRAGGGGEVTDNAYRHGDSYVVTLKIKPETIQRNIVVADLLPAGFEIENPRLDPEGMTVLGVQNTINPSYLEVRDDRLVIAFNRLQNGEHVFNYVVRAITAGEFAYPGATTECMYDPAVRAISAASTITIK